MSLASTKSSTRIGLLGFIESVLKAKEVEAEELVKKMEAKVLKESAFLAHKQRMAQSMHASSSVPAAQAAQAAADMASLRLAIEAFFKKHDPISITDERIDQVLKWTTKNGTHQLNVMLQQKYGEDLTTTFEPPQLQPEFAPFSPPVENPEFQRAVREIQGYFSFHDPKKASQEEAIRFVSLYYPTGGISDMNIALKEKYGESLEEYVAKKEQFFRKALKDFFKVHDPVRLERQFDQLVAWCVNNGEEAVNQRLLEKYGAPLIQAHKKVDEVRSRGESKASAVSVVRNRLGSLKNELVKVLKERQDAKERKLDELRAMLRVFFEGHDPEVLEHSEVLDAWVEWASTQEGDEVEKVLTERYGEGLTSSGLRMDVTGSQQQQKPRPREPTIDV